MIALKCPACNAPLEAPADRPRFFCRFCGTPVELSDLQIDSPDGSHQAPSASPKPVVPIPDHLQVETFGDELTIRWRWFSWIVLFLIPFAIAWNAFLIGWYAMATGMGADMPGPMRWIFLIFPIGHVAVGLGLIYAILTMLFNRTTIRVRHGELSVSHGPIFFPGSKSVAVDDIEQLYCTREVNPGKNGSVHLRHPLHAQLKSGRSVVLIKGSTDRDLVRSVEQLVERHLHLEDRPVDGEAR
ncbi:MAG: hypothetical protein KDA75_15385 [Planctomycetaceae bacterium]|nr:hypothetical protein [Planctomycetaceae bacterium]